MRREGSKRPTSCTVILFKSNIFRNRWTLRPARLTALRLISQSGSDLKRSASHPRPTLATAKPALRTLPLGAKPGSALGQLASHPPQSVKLVDFRGRGGRGDQMSCRTEGRSEEDGAGHERLQATSGVPAASSRGLGSAAFRAALPPPRAARAAACTGPSDRARRRERLRERRRSLRRQTRARLRPVSASGLVSPCPSSPNRGNVGTGEGVPAGSRKPLFSPGHQVNVKRNQAGAGRGGTDLSMRILWSPIQGMRCCPCSCARARSSSRNSLQA